MLEDPSVQRQSVHTPRASLVLAAGEALNPETEIWMGGAHSLIGEALERPHLGASWVIDCAGDMERSYREATARWLACVFPDLDGPLASSSHVERTVREALDAVLLGNGTAPKRIYVMCQHGMNRSGLVSGLILRGLGVDSREAVDRIRLARPGALANDHFRQLVLRG
jgi:hypothetical protein